MLNLLYKELRLAAHPTLYVFMLMGVLLVIPNYPYGVLFLFGTLAPFITFLFGRETRDVYFTTLLPLKKSDVVKGKCLMVVFVQIAQILISLPFAIMRAHMQLGGNSVGVEANVAYYGFGLIILAVFNFIFLTQFYKTAYQVGRSFIIAIIPAMGLVVAMELASHLPPLQWLDSVSPEMLVRQLPILVIGIAIYIVGIFSTYSAAAKRFAQVDL